MNYIIDRLSGIHKKQAKWIVSFIHEIAESPLLIFHADNDELVACISVPYFDNHAKNKTML